MKKRLLSILTCLALYLTLFPASALAEEMEVPENVPVEEVPNETAGAEPAGDSGPTYTAAEVTGFTVSLAEPSVSSISLLGVLNSRNSWIDTGTFANGVYEGYYAQLDDTSRNFYNQLKAAFVSPETSATIAVNHAFTGCTGMGTTVDGGTQISLSQESREEINTWLQENLTTAYLALERDHPETPWLKAESFGFGGESGYSIGIENAAEENGTYTFTATVRAVHDYLCDL